MNIAVRDESLPRCCRDFSVHSGEAKLALTTERYGICTFEYSTKSSANDTFGIHSFLFGGMDGTVAGTSAWYKERKLGKVKSSEICPVMP